MKISREEVIKANRIVHSQLASVYNINEPHYKEENILKVTKNLKEIAKKYNNPFLLDIGCGTGFIIDIAKNIFSEVHGLDATEEMLNRVKVDKDNINLYHGIAEELPFDNESFDVVTAYSFIHHLYYYKDVLREVYRVLKPGGTFYIDLEPNKLFWEAIKELKVKNEYSEIVRREIDSVTYTGKKLNEEYGINPNDFDKAEYYKNIVGGIDPNRFLNDLQEVGFSNFYHEFTWFLGEGYYIHNQKEEVSSSIRSYLETIAPLSSRLYKYVRFIVTK
jgi:ubiquinone/menaquinone biosynthesis C-methylase UbiE